MTISIEQLQAFVATAETGSLSAAARKIGKAQSTVSSLVNNLEIDSALELFDRSVHGLNLTAAGHLVYKDAIALLRASSDLSGRIHSLAVGVEDSVTLVIDHGAISETQLTTVLQHFDQQFPSVELVVLHSTLNDIPQLVLDGIADIGLMLTQEITYREEFNNKAIASITYDAVVGEQHPLAAIEAPTAEDLHHFRYLTTTNRTDLLRKDHSFPASKQWFVDDYRTMINMLKAGLGWAAIPHHLVESALAKGALLTLPNDHLGTMHREVYAIWSKSHELGKAGQFLWQELSLTYQHP